MGFKVFDFINRKKAGMGLLLDKAIAPTLVNEAKNKAYWKDGTSAHARQGLNGGCEGGNGEYTIYLAHGVDYGQILEEGSKPHVIKAKDAPYLHFKTGDGYWRRVKQVNHPGTKPMPILKDTLENNKETIINAIEKYWSE